MKTLRILAAYFCLMASVLPLKAQFKLYTDSKPVMLIDYTNMEGTPYLYEDWQTGNVTLTNGVSNKEPMLLKLNLVNDVISFKDNATGQELEFVVPVQEFSLNLVAGATRHFKSGFKNIDGIAPTAFLEVLSDGKAQLLKRNNKIIFEQQPIGSATKERTFIEKTKYYLVIDGKATVVKADRKSLLAALADKQSALDTYLNVNKINFKSDTQLGKLVDYYNTL
ncbi:hypothetical protein [Mucilaginibacter psychrotolerans]|uniref:DUF4369 domain-containing protein n=1 Tax=Mucilaginibacter psychrotolerans TaxID=1524096 RepID=A0A4Y8SDE6_9SPHI|nr:hypothetical protein [Mucilaginibacter psychrotolerans]TFF36701.1 hypothetical protein E2R66_14720 [Mucilaginibacter psychrotolerans]